MEYEARLTSNGSVKLVESDGGKGVYTLRTIAIWTPAELAALALRDVPQGATPKPKLPKFCDPSERLVTCRGQSKPHVEIDGCIDPVPVGQTEGWKANDLPKDEEG